MKEIKNLIIGTAGHIDHGKTTLVKALTNVDTDTLKEEKERGMTIDIGFAPLISPENDIISIIDVPGHEKFIKNMISGAKGIDFVLFIIACDDGIMPQTIEHKEIIELLEIKHGIIVLTKTDLVNEEQIQNLEENLKIFFKNSIFLKFPIIKVNKFDEKSYQKLYNKIFEELKLITYTKNNSPYFKLDIDKSYSPKGVGTIVSGTSVGHIEIGDTLTIYPQNKKIKIKGIQNHGKNLTSIETKQRCALNITGIDFSEIERGNILSNSLIYISKIFDVYFKHSTLSKFPKNNTRIRLNIGTGEYFGKIKYLHDDFNDISFLQLIMDKEVPLEIDNIGIIRNLTTNKILGSVKILNPEGTPTKKNNSTYLNKLIYRLDKNIDLTQYIYDNFYFTTLNELNINLNSSFSKNDFDEKIYYNEELNIIIHKEKLESIKNKLLNFITEFHLKNPLLEGVSLATINSKFFNNINCIAIFSDLFKVENGVVSNHSFKIKLSKEHKLIKDKILILLKKEKFKGITLDELEKKFINTTLFKETFFFLLNSNLIMRLNDNFILIGFIKEATKILNEYFIENKTLTLAQFRDLLNTNRNIALMYLEYYDSLNITLKIDNYRIKK